MALTTEEESAVLYLYSSDGTIFRYYTALPVSAVTDLSASYPPNNGFFAFESNYATLAPYTVLTTETVSAPLVQASLPAGYSLTIFSLPWISTPTPVTATRRARH